MLNNNTFKQYHYLWWEKLTSTQFSPKMIALDKNGTLSLIFGTGLMVMANTVFAATPIAGFGKALNFDGQDDFIELDNPFTNGHSFTIEFWMKPAVINDGHKEYYDLMGYSGGQYYSPSLSIIPAMNGLYYDSYDSSGTQYANRLDNFFTTTDEWLHIAWVKDETSYKFYKNGRLIDDTQIAPITVYLNSAYHIGKVDNYFAGQLDEVRIWEMALSQSQIQANLYKTLQGNEPGLMVYYPFNNGPNTIAIDQTANYHGELMNMDDTNWVDSSLPLNFAFTTPESSISHVLPSYDADGDTLSYIINNGNKGTTQIDANGTFTYTPEPGHNGTDTFTYQVNDGTQDSNLATVTIELYNNVPTISGSPPTHIKVGRPYHFVPTVDEQDEHPLTYEIEGKPEWAEFNQNTGALTGTPLASNDGDVHNIKINVSDGADTASLAFQLSVGNRKPVTGFGQSLSFDGIDDYVTINNIPRITGDWTFECWVKKNDVSHKSSVLIAGENTSLKLEQWPDTNKVGYTNFNENYLFDYTAPENEWVHLAFVKNNTNIKLYVNGIRKGPSNRQLIDLEPRIIGSKNGGEFLKGHLDEVRIWNITRREAQIKANMYKPLQGDEQGLVAYYTFENGPSSTITDQTANNYHGTLENMLNENWVTFSMTFNTNARIYGENATNTINSQLFGYDADNDPLSYIISKQPEHGKISFLNEDTGMFTYTQPSKNTSVDTFEYQVKDNYNHYSEASTVTININPLSYSTGAYENKQKILETLSLPGAKQLNVSVFGETELDYDFIEILDQQGESLEPPQKFSGCCIDEIFTVTGDTIKIRFKSDQSITGKGVTVKINMKPTVSDINKTVDTSLNNSDAFLLLFVDDFNEHFTDSDTLKKIKITALPTQGDLFFWDEQSDDLQLVSLNQEIEKELLIYYPNSSYWGIDSFGWNGSNSIEYAMSEAKVNILVQSFVDFNGIATNLEEAITEANDFGGSNTITFTKDVMLTETLPPINSNIQFIGNGHTINGDKKYQVFFIQSGVVSVSDLTIANGLARGGDGGNGGVDNFTGNKFTFGGGGGGGAGLGGGIFIGGGQVKIDNVTFENNKAQGGNGGNSLQSEYTNSHGGAGNQGFNLLFFGSGGVFGSGGGGGGSHSGKGGSGTNSSIFGQGGAGNALSEGIGLDKGNDGNWGDSRQIFGIGGGGGGASNRGQGGKGGLGGFGAGGGGGGNTAKSSKIAGIGGSSLKFGGKGGDGGKGGLAGGAGGGGAGLGGAIFVSTAGSLTLRNTHFKNNTAIGGQGGQNNGENGQGKGNAIFVQENANAILNTLTFNGQNTPSNDNEVIGKIRPEVTLTKKGSFAEGNATFTFSQSDTFLAEKKDLTVYFKITGNAKKDVDYKWGDDTDNETSTSQDSENAETKKCQLNQENGNEEDGNEEDGNEKNSYLVTLNNEKNNHEKNNYVKIPANQESCTFTITRVNNEVVANDKMIQLTLMHNAEYHVKNAVQIAKQTIFGQAFTSLSLETSSSAILNEGTLNVSGKLNRWPATNVDLSNLPIKLIIKTPTGEEEILENQTIDANGNYKFDKIQKFTKPGEYTFQTQFDSRERLNKSTSPEKTVIVGNSAGYAIIVQGRIQNDPNGEKAHKKTTDHIYNSLIIRGFKPQNIYYYGYGNTSCDDSGKNPNQANAPCTRGTQPTYGSIKNDFQGAESETCQNNNSIVCKMENSPAPLYLIMVGHGSKEGTFYLYDDKAQVAQDNLTSDNIQTMMKRKMEGTKPDDSTVIVYPETISGVLDDLFESHRLRQGTKLPPSIIILGFCYSGSFIEKLSKENRMIITSAASNQVSYKGLKENPTDNIRTGEYFLEELFQHLEQGTSFQQAFEKGSESTKIYTRDAQHPQVACGSKTGGSENVCNSINWSNLYLGVGNSNSNSLAKIIRIPKTQYLDHENVDIKLFMEVNDVNKVDIALVAVRSPSFDFKNDQEQEHETIQPSIKDDLNLSMSCNPQTKRCHPTVPVTQLTNCEPATENKCFENEQFKLTCDASGSCQPTISTKPSLSPGKYEIFYSIRDKETNTLSSKRRSVLYKNKADNKPPLAFNLLTPLNESEELAMILEFSWRPTTDPDGHTYTLVIAEDDKFNKVVYRQEELTGTNFTIEPGKVELINGSRLGLNDLAQYYWKVEAVDTFGAITSSNIWWFKTNYTNRPSRSSGSSTINK